MYYLKILRTYQWYKNLLIFLPLIFSGRLLDIDAFFLTSIGFVALCLISSANYVINDIVDIKKDRKHPEKKERPLASGNIKILHAIILASVLVLISIGIASQLSLIFMGLIISIFVLTQAYSFWLKDEVFIDILIISINFVIRAVSGAFIISNGYMPYIRISPWLILCPFFLALFLATGKRASDSIILKDKASKHKKVLASYTPELTRSLSIISTTLLIISYSLYIFMSEHQGLFFTLPFALYVIFRYFSFIESGSKIARHPHLILKDKRIMIAIFIFMIIAIFALYL